MFINYAPQTGITVNTYWQGHRATVEALEALHDAIRQATDNPNPSDSVLCSRTAPDA